MPRHGHGHSHIYGQLVRVADEVARNRLRLKFYSEGIFSLANRMLVLLIIQAGLLFLLAIVSRGQAGLEMPTGETLEERFRSASLDLGMFFAWPCVVLVLLRTTALASAHQDRRAGGAHGYDGARPGRVDWPWRGVSRRGRRPVKRVQGSGEPRGLGLGDLGGCIVCSGVAPRSRQGRNTPQEVRAVPAFRKAWAGSLLAVTGAFALGVPVFIGFTRVEDSAYLLLQPGVDTKREQQALLALNDGAAQANKGNLEAAEQTFQRALGLWEELTKKGFAPPAYRINLGQTLYNLGWIRERPGARTKRRSIMPGR